MGSAYAEGKKLAFVVGISKYDKLLPTYQLDNPANDARSIASTLAELGYEVTHETDVTSTRFDELLAGFLDTVGSTDTVVLFLSGHGIEIEGQNYLLPRDVPQEEYGRENRLKRKSISIPDLLLNVRKKRPERTIMILDACRTHPLIPSEFRPNTMAFHGKTSGIRYESATIGEYLMYSAGSGQRAIDKLHDKDTAPHTLYVRHLLPLLRTPGLEIGTLNGMLQDEVYKAAQSVEHLQVPTNSDQLIGEFCFAGCESTEKITSPSPDTPVISKPGLDTPPPDKKNEKAVSAETEPVWRQDISEFVDNPFDLCGYKEFTASVPAGSATEINVRSKDKFIPNQPFRGLEKRVTLDSVEKLFPGCTVMINYLKTPGIPRIRIRVTEEIK